MQLEIVDFHFRRRAGHQQAVVCNFVLFQLIADRSAKQNHGIVRSRRTHRRADAVNFL